MLTSPTPFGAQMGKAASSLRSLPLELLAESAQRQGLSEHLTLRRFDVRDTSAALPDADLATRQSTTV